MGPKPRTQQWEDAWRQLYARELPRAEHEAERDKMIAWAREHGQAEECEAARARSVKFTDRPGERQQAFLKELKL